MITEPFVDHYEILQVSPHADADTIERVFRHLARRWHPDNLQTGDAERFQRLVDAYRTLADPEKRAVYDVQYQAGWTRQWRLVQEAIDPDEFTDDQTLRERLLMLLYGQRRQDMRKPGLGIFALEQLLECPSEHLEFHLWYLKEKEWVRSTDSGLLTITAAGVDQVEASRPGLRRDRQLPARVDGPGREPER
jgi:curved DNA-binding protein CbpA